MSFSRKVKEELAGQISRARHCQIAELAALFSCCGHVVPQDERNFFVKFVTENLTVAKKYFILVKKAFHFDIELSGNIPKDILSKIEQEEQPNEPFDFKTKPFPHQLESFNYAKTHNRFLLGDEQGLGKTKQAIDIAVSKKGPVEHVLIVACVNGLKWNWLHEIETHSNEKGHIIGHRISRTGSNIIEGVSKRIEDIKKQHDEYFYITNIESLRDKEFAATIRTMC